MPKEPIKISELTPATSLVGFYTLGYKIVDGEKKSIRLDLSYVQTAYDNTVDAISKANQATAAANKAAADANTTMAQISQEASQKMTDLRQLEATVSEQEEARESFYTQVQAKEQARQNDEAKRQEAAAATAEAEALRKQEEAKRNATFDAKVQEATNAANDASEQARFAQEEGEKVAQYDNRITLLETGKANGLLVDGGLLYLTSDDEVISDGVEVATGGGGGGSGGGITMKVKSLTASLLSAIAGQELRIGYNFTSVYTDDDTPTGTGTAMYYVNSQKVASATVEQGDNYFEASKYLTVGTNKIKVTVNDATGASRSLSYIVDVISLSITDSYDDALVNTGVITYRYTPVGAVEKTIHFILDEAEIGTEVTTISNRQMSYIIPAQGHGAHRLEVYMTTLVNDTEVRSNTLTHDLICVVEGNNTVIIASPFNQAAAKQYDMLAIPFIVYNPAVSSSPVVLSVNDTVVSEQTVDRTLQTWNYRLNRAGSVALKIASGAVSKTFNLKVSEAETIVEAETADLELYLTSQNRSNNDNNKDVWKSGDTTAIMTGFNWRTNGWIADESGSVCLRVGSGAQVTIPIMPFSKDFRATGKTIEIEFLVRDVYRYDTPVISCWSGNRGIQITSQQAQIKSEQSNITTMFKDQERIRLAFVVEKRADNRLLSIYVNGIKSGTAQYPDTDNFIQSNPVGISIGGSDATVDIYNIRLYYNNLNRFQLLNNYIADIDDYDQKVSMFERNDIYDSYGSVSFEKVLKHNDCLVFEGDLPQYKGDKKTNKLYHYSANGLLNWWANVKNNVQGTSSQYYPRKNYKFELIGGITYIESGEQAEAFQLSDDVHPAKIFCIKTDFAESSGTHNTGVANMVDWALKEMDILTEAQKTDPVARTTIAGKPYLLFHKATADSQPVFVGKINLNTDKAAENTFGFKEGDESWEFLNNTSDMTLFKSADFTSWQDNIEARYPDGATDTTNVKRVWDWVVSCKGNIEKFKSEFNQYFDKDQIIFYALLTLALGMTDQRAKNMFLTRIGGKQWLFIFYDNDTILPINNEAVISFLYNVEPLDTVDNKYVWNGADSELWKLVDEAFADEMREMYYTLRQRNIFSYERMVEYLYTRQADKWCESVYNEDGYYKYEQPLIEGYLDYSGSTTNPQVVKTGAYLYALQGSREMYGKWIWKNRFLYLDSKYLAGSILGDTAVFRTYTPVAWTGVEPNADITLTSFNAMYFNVKWGSVTRSQRVGFNETVKMIAPADMQFNDTETIIYGASLIASLGDLSALYVGSVDVSKMTKLKELIIGSAVEGYQNTNMTVLSVGTNNMLRKVDVQNCPNLIQPIDLTGCENLEEVYAQGTGLTAVLLPSAGILKKYHLPATITNLTIKNQPLLTDENFILDGKDNITTIVLENVVINTFALLQECLATGNLQRIRCINITGSAATADILYRIAEIGGIDENGYNIDRAVLTGSFHVGTIRQDKLEELAEIYPELVITYDELTYPPVVTFVFTSSQNKTITGGKFTSNRRITKVNEFTFKVTAEVGEEITYTYSCNNHVEISGTVTCSGDEVKEYTVEYIPLRTIKVQQINTSTFVLNAFVAIGNESYNTGTSGIIQIRGKSAVSGTVTAEDYNDKDFIFEEISDDTINTVSMNPQATITFTVKDDNNTIINNAIVFVGKKEATTNSSGKCTIKLKSGTYVYSASYQNYFAKGEITVTLSNQSIDVILSPDVSSLIPEPNGNIQLLLTGIDGTLTISSAATDYIIDWGDNELTSASGTGEQTYNHTYSDNSVHQVEVRSCTEVTACNGSSTCLVAYWSIGNSKVKNLTFSSFSKLLYVGLVFNNDTERTSFEKCFMYCSTLTSIPVGLFYFCTKVKSFQQCFSNCTKLESIPDDLFSKCTEVTSFRGCFARSSLSSIPIGLFDNCTKLETLGDSYSNNFDGGCFEFCKITSIPDGLFKYNTLIRTLSRCFSYCENLSSIPIGLFDNCPKISKLDRCFYGCSNLMSIPVGLLDSCTDTFSLEYIFKDCTKLESIPDDLFSKCTNVYEFSGVFGHCSSLTSIPSGLFDNCIKIKDISFCFDDCSKLSVIPTNLFDYCTEITDISYCFRNCLELKQLPALWILYYGKKVNKMHCFENCNAASNWSEVPVSWGGNGPEWYPPFDSTITIKIIKDAAWWLNQSVIINNTSFTQLGDGSYSARLSGVRVNQELEVSINGSPQGIIVLEENKTSYMLLVGDNSKLYSTLDYTTGNLNEDSIISNDGWAYDSEVGGLRSKKITSNGSTIFEVKVSAGQSTITYGQNSESNFDYCTLYTGGSTKLIDLKGTTYQGDNLTIDVEVTENLKFTYHKDSSGDTGKDAFWIKKIIGGLTLPNLPPDFVPATPVAVSGAVLADIRAVNYRLARVETALGFND